MEVEKILLPVKLTNSNSGQGHKWYSSHKERNKLRKLLSHVRRSEPYPRCDVVLTRVLGPRERLWDSSNILRGNAKQLIDALVELGWWKDDGPKFIRHCDGRQDASRRHYGPSVEVEIRIL